MKKKGQVTQYVLFFGIAFFIIVIAALLAPAGTTFNLALYSAGEDILDAASDDIANIQDATIRDQVNQSLEDAKGAAAENIIVNNAIFQWGWIAVILVFFITLFIVTRQQVEVSRGGFI